MRSARRSTGGRSGRLLGVGLLCCAALSGCANLNEGAINYRRVHLTPKRPPLEASTGLALVQKYQRSAPDDGRIAKGDSISVHLSQAFIKDFYEMAAFWRFESEAELRGEIAVVVSAFELAEGKDLDFSPSAAESGRVVYYNDDVRKGQFLNFSYLPVYGPITYNGRPLVFQFYIIELDTGNEQLKPLLSSLAALGKTAYPPASPILSLLDTLGKAVLSGNKSDVIFRYSMVLHPDRGYVRAAYPVLEAGHYVFVRKEDRQAEEEWGPLTFDEQEGRLRLAKGQSFRGDTYLVLDIQKGFDATNLDLAQNTYGNLLRKLGEATTRSVTEVKGIIDGFTSEQVRTRTFGELRGLAGDLGRLGREEADRARRLAEELVEGLARQLQEEASRRPETLTADQIDYLLRQLRILLAGEPTVRALAGRGQLAAKQAEIVEGIVREVGKRESR